MAFRLAFSLLVKTYAFWAFDLYKTEIPHRAEMFLKQHIRLLIGSVFIKLAQIQNVIEIIG